jgi:hypothetical protein
MIAALARSQARSRAPNFRPEVPTQTPFMPSLPDYEIARLIGSLAPAEMKALHEIAENSDLITVGRERWLLVPASDALLDTLAGVGADMEDMEPGLDDEPSPDREEDTEDYGIDDMPHDEIGVEF